MTYDDSLLSIFDKKINYGRHKIILDYEKVDETNIVEVLQKAIPWHKRNEADCRYLIKYFLGEQDILNRPAPETSNINNQVVVNYAYPITREVVGYTFGNPLEYIQRDVGKRSDVEKLSDTYENLNAYNIDTITAIYCSICGIGYQITLPSSEISENNVPEVPITMTSLDPRNTFCVFSNIIGNPQIMSCTIIHNDNQGDTYICYTNDKVFELDDTFNITDNRNNPMSVDPITMFENSIFRTGDWEQAISVMNASNIVASDSLNDIENIIRSLLVISGAEFEEGGEETSLKKIKKNRLLTIASATGGNVDAKFISPKVDSSSIENIRQYLEDARNIITGIPDRQTASGGDTGTAVLNRNGWTDIEIVAKLKELFFKKGKKEQLKVGIKVMQLLGLVSKDLNATNIDITIGRHTLDNLQTKTQAFSTLVATNELATIDALEMSGLTNRVNEVVERGKKAKEEKEKKAIELAKQGIDTSTNETRSANNEEKKKIDDGNSSNEN